MSTLGHKQTLPHVRAISAPCPLYPQQRTLIGRLDRAGTRGPPSSEGRTNRM